MNKPLYDETYERQLLGIMLMDNSVIDEVITKVQGDFFFIKRYGLYFSKIVELYKQTDTCDIVMLSAQFPKTAADIASLTDSVSTTSNFNFYADKIKDFYLARKLKIYSQNLVENVSENNINDLLEQTDDMAISSMKDISKYEPVNSHTFCNEVVQNIQQAYQNRGKLVGIDTGFESINSFIGGLPNESLVVIGARASIGKSAFATQLFDNIILNGTPSCMFSFEMSRKQVENRMIADVTNIPLSNIKSGAFTMSDFQKINDAASKFYDKQFLLYDSVHISRKFREVTSKIRIHAKEGYKVFFLDHLGLLRYENENLDLRSQIGRMTGELHSLAQRLNICIVALCQLNRAAETTEPNLSSLKESGDIEQDADMVVLIHRARQQNNELSIPSKVIIAKNRDGACGSLEFDFMPRLAKFREHKELESEIEQN